MSLAGGEFVSDHPLKARWKGAWIFLLGKGDLGNSCKKADCDYDSKKSESMAHLNFNLAVNNAVANEGPLTVASFW